MQLARIGDCLAIPFFLWLIIYFCKKPMLTTEEKVLATFCVGGFVADLYFVFGSPI